MNKELKGKIALITGGSKGIGLGIANKLSIEGVKIILVSRNIKNLDYAVNNIQENGGEVILTVNADSSMSNFIETIRQKMDNNKILPDIIIYNSGGPPMGTYLEHDIDIWNKHCEQNLMSGIKLIKEYSQNMIKKNWGRIINITSTNSIEPTSEMVLSSTFRAAISAFTKSISLTLCKNGITVNTICPGGVATDRLKNLIRAKAERENSTYEEELRNAEKSIPIGRFAEPAEIGDFVHFLCTSKADYITGQSIPFDGGLIKSF